MATGVLKLRQQEVNSSSNTKVKDGNTSARKLLEILVKNTPSKNPQFGASVSKH